MLFPERLNLHIHARRQVQLHQRIHRLLRRLENIEQPLMRANLELLPRLLIHVRRTQHAVLVLHRRQRNRPRDLCPSAPSGFNNLARRLIQNAVVVSLKPTANPLFSNHVSLSLTPPGVAGRKEPAASSKPHHLSCHPERDAFCLAKDPGAPREHSRKERENAKSRVRRASLLNNLRNRSRTHRMPAFANGKPQALFHRYRRDQLNHQRNVVPWHDHLSSSRKLGNSSDIGSPQIKLRTVSLEERRMPSTLFLRQDVNLSLEFRVRRDRSRLRQHHTALDIFLRNAA